MLPVGGWAVLGGGNLTKSDSDHLNLLENQKKYSVNNENVQRL